MKYLIDILLFVDICLVISTFFSAVYYTRYRLKINEYSLGKMAKPSKVFVLLPAFKEQELVTETLEYYSRITDQDCKIIVITSEQEEYENARFGGSLKTTQDCVNEYLHHNASCNIIHLHGDYIKGTKSTQLNYALDYIKNKLSVEDFSTCYIGVYDFDSRPNLDVIIDLKKVISLHSYPEIIQQVPINLKNMDELFKNRNILMLLHCFQSMVRSVGIELFACFMNIRKIFIPFYCMGAGMYLRMDTLIDNGEFPEPTDDLTLGYRLYLGGKRLSLLPCYNVVEIPDTVRYLVKQDSLIFNGVCSGLRELHNKSSIRRKTATFLTIFHNILLRTFIPWLYIFYVGYIIFCHNINMEILCILVFPFLRTIAGFYAMKKADPECKKYIFSIRGFAVLISSYIWRPLRTLGPYKMIIKYIKESA